VESLKCEIECLKDEQTNELYDNIDFCNVNELAFDFSKNWNGSYILPTVWRFLPIGDSFVDIFLSRDSDSNLQERELHAVNEWLNSSTLFHIMRAKKSF
jgi:hypothetical protein